jgi:hypothetical protein
MTPETTFKFEFLIVKQLLKATSALLVRPI